MIYIILYAIIDPAHPGQKIGGLYHGWAHDLGDAQKTYSDLVLTPDCCRKEIWQDNGKGYRRLIMQEEYKGE